MAEPESERPGRPSSASPFTILAPIIVSLAGLLLGYDSGYTNGILSMPYVDNLVL